ncbi:PLP-dependent aminotransferase family protein [Streptomyces sp. NPDC088864]|uniref:MocR-like pyridoxine biosynthesis transcription factor PdxR n=1 Tax=Streptomyces sp. NPDC088864 TaxID=3365910 RepID=UPI0037F198D8
MDRPLPGQRAKPHLAVPVALDRDGGRPLVAQLVDALREAVFSGLLPPGERLPSTRTLAQDLAVSRTVTAEAYTRLEAEGLLAGRTGSGTYVARLNRAARRVGATPAAPAPAAPGPATAAPRPAFGLRTGETGPVHEGSDGWARAWRETARTAAPTRYQDAAGLPGLRAALAGHLARTRGLVCAPDDIVVTSGTTQSMDLVFRTLLRPGDAVGCEDPGHPVVRSLIRAHGLEAAPVPVDEDGARVEVLAARARAPRLAHVTPSHQFPLGVRMSVGRRLDLVAWARAHHSWIVEDDYDSEYRYNGPPLPSLAGLDRDRVIYLGTLSKVLTPALRCGYLVAPGELPRRIAELKDIVDGPLSWPVQHTVLRMLSSGALERRVRRTRLHYARARNVLREALEPVADLVTLTGLEAGLHAVLLLADGIDGARVARRAAALGVEVAPLSAFRQGPSATEGLVVGYGGLPLEDLAAAVSILTEAIAEHRP